MGTRKLILLDIDGPLTAAGAAIPPESAQEALKAARAKGHGVYICTGRNPGMTKAVLEAGAAGGYGFDGAICCAGGYVTCGGEVLYDHPLSPQDQAALVSALRESGVVTVLEARDAAYADGDVEGFVRRAGPGNSEVQRWSTAIQDRLGVLPIEQYKGEPIYKATFACLDVHQVDGAREALGNRFSCRIHRLFDQLVNGEFISRAFDKGRAVQMVCEHLGVPVEDTVGFGDSMNDWELIETAGVGVCMGNGSPELQVKADLVCPSVSEGGVAWTLRKLGLV